jgi:hypothetical protein
VKLGRPLLALALLAALALAGTLGVVLERRWARSRKPVATIPGSALAGVFLDEVTLAVARDRGQLEVYALGEGTAELSTQYTISTIWTRGRGFHRGFPVRVQQDEGVVSVRSLATDAVVQSLFVDPAQGNIESVAFSPGRDFAAIARRVSVPYSQVAGHKVEVRALRDSGRALRRIDLGETKWNAPDPWFAFEIGAGKLHVVLEGRWRLYSLANAQKLDERALPAGAEFVDLLATGELLLRRDAEVLAWSPHEGGERKLATEALEVAVTPSGERVLARGAREISLFDAETGRALFRQPLPSDDLRARRARDKDEEELAAVSPSGERVALVRAGPDGTPRIEVWLVPRW